MLTSDVSRAFFEAPAKRKVAVRLPEEALQAGESRDRTVGLLQQSLYGTRDAAVNFQNEVKRMMQKFGYVQAKYNASLYYHPATGVRVMVHGDDFVAVGWRSAVRDFRKQVASRFTVQDKMLGGRTDLGEIKETRILNRIVRVTAEGWEYEADQRHADLIVREMGVSSAKPTKTPGEDEPGWKLEDGERPVDRSQLSKFRAIAARANYLAPDRLDLQYAVKECCRGMASAEARHWEKLKRIARYLVGRPRAVWKYRWRHPENVVTYSDSDFAGCRRTAKSTSGGIVMRGGHHIKSWSSTQKKVTLSSAEAELAACIKASAETIGVAQMAGGLGRQVEGEVYVDSSAALGVVNRKGNGELRHIRVGHLWIQQTAEDEILAYRKVHGKNNPADVCTKYVTQKVMDDALIKVEMEIREGRAQEEDVKSRRHRRRTVMRVQGRVWEGLRVSA